MKYKTTMTFKAECAVKYRYTCVYCGHETEWFEAKLSQIARHSQKSQKYREIKGEHGPKALEKTANTALKRLYSLISILEGVISDPSGEYIIPNEPFVVEQYNETFIHGNKCPSCKTRQNWYPAIYAHVSKWKYTRFYAIIALVFGSLLGLIFNSTLLYSYEVPILYFFAFGLTIVFAGGLVGFVRATHLIKSRKPTNPSIHSVPEIVWGTPTIELVGASGIRR